MCEAVKGPPETIIGISDWRSSLRKGALRNFAKFTGKHLCHSPFFNNIAGLSQCFPVNFAKYLTAPFLQNTYGRLLPKHPEVFLPDTCAEFLWTSHLIEKRPQHRSSAWIFQHILIKNTRKGLVLAFGISANKLNTSPLSKISRHFSMTVIR